MQEKIAQNESGASSAVASEESVSDNMTAQTLLVDGVHGAQVRNGVFVMNFTQHVFPAPKSGKEPINEVVLRLAMPLPAFENVFQWMKEARQNFIEQGVLVLKDEGGDG